MKLDSVEQSIIYNFTLYKLTDEKGIPLDKVKGNETLFRDLAFAVEDKARQGFTFGEAFDDVWVTFADRYK